MALILYSARLTRRAIAGRVDLIRESVGDPLPSISLDTALIRTGPRGTGQAERQEMARLLSKFGVAPHRTAGMFVVVRVAAACLLAALGYVGASHWSLVSRHPAIPLLLAFGCGIAGWFLPARVIGRLIKVRTKAVVSGLPDALELLVICVEAGLSFEDGIDRIVGGLKISQPVLAEELALTSADLKILPSREQALANLAERVDVPSVRSVVTTLSQTLRFGTPLAQALRMVAGELRSDTLIRLEERANQLPTLMTIPMMLFIMPTIFMIIAGPAVLRIMDIFSHH